MTLKSSQITLSLDISCKLSQPACDSTSFVYFLSKSKQTRKYVCDVCTIDEENLSVKQHLVNKQYMHSTTWNPIFALAAMKEKFYFSSSRR